MHARDEFESRRRKKIFSRLTLIVSVRLYLRLETEGGQSSLRDFSRRVIFSFSPASPVKVAGSGEQPETSDRTILRKRGGSGRGRHLRGPRTAAARARSCLPSAEVAGDKWQRDRALIKFRPSGHLSFSQTGCDVTYETLRGF